MAYPAGAADARVRWSTSSAPRPRGRSPSPSDLSRGFSGRRVSVGTKQKSESRDLSKESSKIGVDLEKRSGIFEELEMGKRLNGIRVLDQCNGKLNLSSNSMKSDEKVGVVVGVDEVGNGVEICMEDLNDGKEKGLGEGGVGGRVVNKYPSKLHEKLAFLEGKVKRIASDIKKTKEMLDMNNPDTSKVILSDIQSKISGIEKAMVIVGGDSDGKMGLSKGNGDCESGMVEKGKSKEGDIAKSSVKGLNSEELEARLFPHHKLLRNRTSLKAQTNEPHVVGPNCESKVEGKLFSPIDENPIAVEFLASLKNEQGKITTRDRQAGLEYCEVQEMDGAASTGVQDSSNLFSGKCDVELNLTSDERLDDFDDQENREDAIIGEETEDTCSYQLNEIGCKTSTGGWFVSEGEAVLLAHNDGSCSFYDVANSEEKAEYKPPSGVSPGIWRDCWIIRAPGADGCSGRYVVAASAGNATDSGFCSWDFYTKDVRAFQIEGGTIASRTVLGPLPNNIVHRRNAVPNILVPETQQWWYKPCGPLIISTASCQKGVRIFDIRDGEQIMKWDVQKPVSTMDYSSPLQWRNRGKVVVAEAEAIAVWDVNSLSPQALVSVSSTGRKISALHVNNTDAELGGGVRQRVSSAEAEGNDGVFCTQDSINILDFRHPSGVGLKIPKLGVSVQSVFSRGDSIFLGCSNLRSVGGKQSSSQVQQYSLRKQRLHSTYALPESNAHFHYTAITQVWGNSNLVMGACGLGLFVFDALRDDGLQSFTIDSGNTQKIIDTIGPNDLCSPTFDYLSSRALLISRDRPAVWRRLSEV